MASPPRPIRPRLHPACAGPRPMKWASEAGASAGERDRRLWVGARVTPRKRGRLWLPAKRTQQAGRLNVARRRPAPFWSPLPAPAIWPWLLQVPIPAAGLVLYRRSLRLFVPPSLRASVPLSLRPFMPSSLLPPASPPLPFWQSPPRSLVPGPRSRRSRRERKSHFCRNTYVNGHLQKAHVF